MTRPVAGDNIGTVSEYGIAPGTALKEQAICENQVSDNMDINIRFLPVGEVIFRRIGDEAILVPRRDGVADLCNYLVLENEVTTTMWRLANAGMSVAEIASKVAEEYDVTVEAAVADATEFCESLVRAKLLSVRQV